MDADTETNACHEKKKSSIYKWRENNKEKYNVICNKDQVIFLFEIFSKIITSFHNNKILRS